MRFIGKVASGIRAVIGNLRLRSFSNESNPATESWSSHN